MVPAPRESTVRATIGGAWAVSWATLVVCVLANAVAVATGDPGSAGAWLAFSAGGAVAIATALWLAHITVLRSRRARAVPVSVVVGVGLAAGVARAASMDATAWALGIGRYRPWGAVLVASALGGVVLVAGTAFVLGGVAAERGRRDALTRRLAALREDDRNRLGLADVLDRAARDELTRALDDARTSLASPAGDVSPEERMAVADRLRVLVKDTLRPLSHRLHAAGDDTPEPRLRASWFAVRALPVLPAPTAMLVVLVLLVGADSLPGMMAFGACVWIALAGVTASARRWPWARRHEFAMALAALVVVGIVAPVIIRGMAQGLPYATPAVLGTAIAAPVMALVIVGFARAALRGAGERKARLEAEVGTREVEALVANRDIAKASRDLARYVNGALQVRLLATASAMERAAGAGDDAGFDRAVREARAALADAGVRGDGPGAVVRGLASELTAIGMLWKGFLSMSVEISPELPPLGPAVVADISRIVSEAVANARTHGGARAVVALVQPAAGGVRVHVSDDGRGPGADAVPGMGSAWLDLVAPGSWSLAPGPGGVGSALEVIVPAAIAQGRWAAADGTA